MITEPFGNRNKDTGNLARNENFMIKRSTSEVLMPPKPLDFDKQKPEETNSMNDKRQEAKKLHCERHGFNKSHVTKDCIDVKYKTSPGAMEIEHPRKFCKHHGYNKTHKTTECRFLKNRILPQKPHKKTQVKTTQNSSATSKNFLKNPNKSRNDSGDFGDLVAQLATIATNLSKAIRKK